MTTVISETRDIAARTKDGQDVWLNVSSVVVPSRRGEAEVSVCLVDEGEMARLNSRYRGKDTATNVLSFPADLPPEIGLPLLGDLVICAPLVDAEAAAQQKPVDAHWAHLTIHGVLHLLGYDHQAPDQAAEMEALEISLLASMGIADPYAEPEA